MISFLLKRIDSTEFLPFYIVFCQRFLQDFIVKAEIEMD